MAEDERTDITPRDERARPAQREPPDLASQREYGEVRRRTEAPGRYSRWYMRHGGEQRFDDLPGPYAGVGPRGYRRSDERIRDDVCERLTRHGGVDASEVDVQVRDGEVTLRGVVEDRRAKRVAEDAILSVPGVTDVQNLLRLRGIERYPEVSPRQEAARLAEE